MSASKFTISILALALASGSPTALEAKSPKTQKVTAEKAVKVLSEEESEKYLPSPTRVPRLEGIVEKDPVFLPNIFPGDIGSVFSSARTYMEKEYKKPKELETIITYEGKTKVLWEPIPYIIVEQSFLEGKSESTPTLIHVFRKKLSSDKLGTWRGPVEKVPFSIDIVGASKNAKSIDEILMEKSLGAGTQFRIQDSEGKVYVVLATRYPRYKEDPNIQTPYSEGLNMPSVVERGKRYFETLIKQAQEDVEKTPWNSPELQEYGSIMIEILGLVENMNPPHLLLSSEKKDALVAREMIKVYALLGANEDRAFRRSSKAGANGIMQIIGPTFRILYERYLKGFLDDGFESTTGNHRMSLFAAKAHIEMQWAEYRKRPILYKWLKGPGKPYIPYILAAGYNSNNVHRADELENIIKNNMLKEPWVIIKMFYENLSMPRGNPNETRGYMQKSSGVIAIRFSQFFARLPLSMLSRDNPPK